METPTDWHIAPWVLLALMILGAISQCQDVKNCTDQGGTWIEREYGRAAVSRGECYP